MPPVTYDPPIPQLWHPHQKLWNWRLVEDARAHLRWLPKGGGLAERLIVGADSLILLGRALGRRAAAGRLAPYGSRSILWIDCGVHREGLELQLAAGWLRDYQIRFVAYEAGAAQYAEAVKNLAHMRRLDLHHAAVVGPDHQDPVVAFHVGNEAWSRDADSLFEVRGEKVEEVAALHVSDEVANAREEVVILRMNIEGAELFVIEDLVAAGCLERISGFYGMWDDLSKIDPARDLHFRKLLRDHGIRPFTFNGRDLAHRLRRAAIRYDVRTSVRRKAR